MTIEQAMVMKDGMTPVFNKMLVAMTSTLKMMKSLDAQSNQGMNDDMFKEVEAEINQANNALIKFTNNVDYLNNKRKKGNSTFSFMAGNMLANYASRALSSLGGVFSEAIQTASDLAEVQNVVDVVYKQSAEEVNNWSKTALNAYGMNEVSAKKYMGTMGAMLNSMNISSDATLSMSEDLTALAGDMASFYNIGIEEAFTKIRSGISGETEPLKQLGINMNVANLEAYALSQGMNKAYNEMSMAEQATLRYNYIMSVTKDAQGDFARTSGSFANQQKLMSENWKQLTSTLAAYFLPVFTKVFQVMNGAFSFLTEHSEQVVAALLAIGIVLAFTLVPKFYEAAAAAIASATATAASWGIALWPLLLIVVAVVAIISVLNQFGVTVSDVMGYVGGVIGAVYALLMNIIIYLYNTLGPFATFVGNLFIDPVGAIKMLFLDLAINVLGWVNSMASALESFVNLIPGVKVDMTSGLTSYIDELTNAKNGLAEQYGLNKFEMADYKDVGQTASEWKDSWSNFQIPEMGFPAEVTVDGGEVDSIGKIKGDVKITDEDIKLLKDLATHKYVNRYTTLSPNMKVEFSGPINNDVDVDNVITEIERRLEEVSDASVIEEVVYG